MSRDRRQGDEGCEAVIERLTTVVAYQLVPVVLVVDVGALLAVVEARVVLVVVPGWRWWGFGRVRDWQVAQRAHRPTSDGASRAVVVVGGAVLAVLGAVLVLLGAAVGRVVVLGREDVGVAAGAAALRRHSRVAAAVLSWLRGFGPLFTIALCIAVPIYVFMRACYSYHRLRAGSAMG